MSILDQLREGISSSSPEQTEQIAEAFAAQIPLDHIIALHGDLGAGKTTFVRGLARYFKINEPITSPTFNLYTIYQGSRQLIHLDAYRLSSSADLDALMIGDFMHSPWCFVIEWPERIPEAIPDEAWHLELSIDAEQRHHIKLLETKI